MRYDKSGDIPIRIRSIERIGWKVLLLLLRIKSLDMSHNYHEYVFVFFSVTFWHASKDNYFGNIQAWWSSAFYELHSLQDLASIKYVVLSALLIRFMRREPTLEFPWNRPIKNLPQLRTGNDSTKFLENEGNCFGNISFKMNFVCSGRFHKKILHICFGGNMIFHLKKRMTVAHTDTHTQSHNHKSHQVRCRTWHVDDT